MKLSKSLAGLCAAFAFASAAHGANPTNGKIVAIYADPNDFVVELPTAGNCGSKFFHFKRANANFKEAVAVALTALSADKTVTVYTTGVCEGDRNVASHLGVFR